MARRGYADRAAYLADRSELALGAAYDLGREAVTAKLSVLDLADAHHRAMRDVHAGDEAAVLGQYDGGPETVDVRGLPAEHEHDG